MTGDTDDTDDSTDRFITRRGILNGVVKGVAGIGVGLGVGAGSIYTLGTQTDLVDMDSVARVADKAGVDLNSPEKVPEKTEPDNPSSPEDTPWNKNTVVVTVDRADNVRGRDLEAFENRYQNAAAFWTDHIAATEPFDLTLSFELSASNPDIRFVEKTITYCAGEYRSPATENDSLTPYVCVSTLTEAPDNTPIEPELTMCGGGPAMYELIVTHALGRLIGYDIWNEPVSVMTPKILFGPAHADHPDATSILGRPGRGAMFTDHYIENIERSIAKIQDADSRDVSTQLISTRDDMQGFIDGHKSYMSDWKSEVKDIGFPRYADAYDEAVLHDDIAYIVETLAMMTALAENKSGEEIVGSEELDTVIDRLETITTWPETREAFDVQVHRAWTEMVWSEWTSE